MAGRLARRSLRAWFDVSGPHAHPANSVAIAAAEHGRRVRLWHVGRIGRVVGEAKTVGNPSGRLRVLTSKKGLGGVGRGIGTRSWQRPLSSASRTAATSAVTAVEYGRTRIWSGPDRTTRARLAWHESGRTPAGRVLGGAVPRGSDGVSGRWVSGFPWGTGKRSAPGASGRHPNGPRPLAGSVRRRRIERVPKAAQIQDC